MRSINVVIALLFGYFVAAVSDNNGDDYVVSTKIDAGARLCVKPAALTPRMFLPGTTVPALFPDLTIPASEEMPGLWSRTALVNKYPPPRPSSVSAPSAAESITFLWVFTYPLTVYAPLILPSILAFIVTTVETIGDVTTTAEVSKLDVTDPEHFQVRTSATGCHCCCRSLP